MRALRGTHTLPLRSRHAAPAAGGVLPRSSLGKRAARSSALPDGAPDGSSGGAAEDTVRVGWDPDGLFKNAPPPTGDLFAQREQRRRAAAAAAAAAAGGLPAAVAAPTAVAAAPAAAAPGAAVAAASPSPPAAAKPLQSQPPRQWARPIDPVSPEELAAGGVPLDRPASAAARDALRAKLSHHFIPVDLDRPGVRVLCFDPPVLVVEGFLSADECDALVASAQESGCLRASMVGSGNAGGPAAGANAYDGRRTSSSMLVDPSVRTAHPGLAAKVDEMQQRAVELFCSGEGSGHPWGATGRMPKPGQYTFESPQLARYTQGQHFLSHEDAFPLPLARSNGFNRHATLLMYLNDVNEGGATCFDHLGLAVQPRKGRALIFFPATSDGAPDPRTLHTAASAADTKWVCQQWIARGFAARPAAAAAAGSSAAAAAAAVAATSSVVVSVPASSGGAKKGKGKKGGTRGFGGR